MALTLAGLKTLLGAAGAAPAAVDKLRAWKGGLAKAEREILTVYLRRLDERRVFFVSYNAEVFEACVSSLDTVRDFTDQTLAQLEHPAARALLGAFLDDLRGFVDRWRGVQTPSRFRPAFELIEHMDEVVFFRELGALRERAMFWRLALVDLDAKLPAPTDPR